ERHDRVIDVIIRTEQSFLFATEGHEHDCSARPCISGTEQASQLQHAGDTRSVVVSAVLYLAFARREAAFAAESEMIVVLANNDYFLLKRRIRAIENAD